MTARTSDSAFIAWLPALANSYTAPDLGSHMRAAVVKNDYAQVLNDVAQLGTPLLTLPYELYAAARLAGDSDPVRVFLDRTRNMDDRSAATKLRYVLETPLPRLRAILASTIASLRAQDSLTVTAALDVVRKYAGVLAFEMISPHRERLLAADDARRFIITPDIVVPTKDGAAVCVLVVRPRQATGRLPALLNFTIYESAVNLYEARRSAAHGYAGIEGLTRGKGCSPNQPVSHEYDGVDAAALIEWIAKQPWSDGRVGMYGGSYEGFTQWSAAKHMPRALKAMMTSVTHAPGIDFPMDGNVFVSYAYPWPFYTTSKKAGLDSTTYNDADRWTRLNTAWYKSGRAYRDLPLIDGTPNPVFLRWLSHPAYDAYWQSMMPVGKEFARIDIPVLTTTGYMDGGQMGALWYFRQHNAWRANARHYLLIGPYDHIAGQRGTLDPLGRVWYTDIQGIPVDSVAQLDMGELRYAWFDFVLKGRPRPALLKDKVNYEVMGGNVWKHAPSLAAMHARTLRVSLTKAVQQVVDLSDRRDVGQWGPSGDLLDPSSSVRSLVDTTSNIAHSFMFSSPELVESGEVSGLFSGSIRFVTNKRDFDYSVTLFELTREGKYIQLNYHWGRASYAHSRSRRMLLVPGKRSALSFESNRLTSKRIAPGSRIVVVIAIMKNPSQEINYGSGKAVADETIKDAGDNMTVRWLPGTYVDVPFTPTLP